MSGWKYESSDSTPTVVVVANPRMAMNWVRENEMPGSWRDYFSRADDSDLPNWPVPLVPGILAVMTPDSDVPQVVAQGSQDHAAGWLGQNADQFAWEQGFTVQWTPPQVIDS